MLYGQFTYINVSNTDCLVYLASTLGKRYCYKQQCATRQRFFKLQIVISTYVSLIVQNCVAIHSRVRAIVIKYSPKRTHRHFCWYGQVSLILTIFSQQRSIEQMLKFKAPVTNNVICTLLRNCDGGRVICLIVLLCKSFDCFRSHSCLKISSLQKYIFAYMIRPDIMLFAHRHFIQLLTTSCQAPLNYIRRQIPDIKARLQ